VSVLELPPDAINRSQTRVGDLLKIERLRKEPVSG
jgi:uncharacterized membrane protein (UPF0127 family)